MSWMLTDWNSLCSFGGFDLVVGGIPCNNPTASIHKVYLRIVVVGYHRTRLRADAVKLHCADDSPKLPLFLKVTSTTKKQVIVSNGLPHLSNRIWSSFTY
ncbi:hypothetical protein RchiOBHm_Chr1g0383211 [Rosa chinensis]|uniref:Uncharacterized protein n=1 Tax=Rosa chinensis TaxID=74649 RepID=A0A2P6SPL9_ROSCH|nr:hypothetical protein RchiOBHm_Chr1g0383211 [Rosa chinensis]